jgi:hypothetical protein
MFVTVHITVRITVLVAVLVTVMYPSPIAVLITVLTTVLITVVGPLQHVPLGIIRRGVGQAAQYGTSLEQHRLGTHFLFAQVKEEVHPSF